MNPQPKTPRYRDALVDILVLLTAAWYGLHSLGILNYAIDDSATAADRMIISGLCLLMVLAVLARD